MTPATASPCELIGDGCFGTIAVATSAPLLGEHFTTFPVLPGSFSMMLSVSMLFRVLGAKHTGLGPGVTLHRVNFTRPVRPGEQLTAYLRHLRQDDARTTAHFELSNASKASVMNGVISWEQDR